MSSIKDVAKRAGVSISTVSNVLNQTKYVSPELTLRVQNAVEELSYEAHPIARMMKSNKSGMIGVIVEDMCGVFYPYVVRGIRSVVEEKGYQIIICDTQGTYGDIQASKREEIYFQKLVRNFVDGIIFVSMIPVEEKKPYFKEILQLVNQYKRIPVVSIERNLASEGIDSVYFDGYNNSKLAVQHLIDCGCKKIGNITGPKALEIAHERIRGYLDILTEKGMPLDSENMIVYGDYSHQRGYWAMQQLLEAVPDIDGVFCANDQMAVGALRFLQEVGKKVPEEIKVMGYDDVFLSSIFTPTLSTIHIQKESTGIKAAELLMNLIENEGKPHRPVSLKMEGRLVVRQSTLAGAPEDWIFSNW